MPLKLYNTLHHKKEVFEPLNPPEVKIYSCGPTVYYRMQVGNLRAYASFDILHRTLLYLGYRVKRIINLTDVGHMTSDENFGEDKLEKGAKREGKDPYEIAKSYIRTVLEDFALMNMLAPDGSVVDPDISFSDLVKHGWTPATEHVDDMIKMILEMEKHGYTYETKQAVYFDTSKVKDYTKLSGQSLDEKKEGAREDVNIDPDKKHPADFVLWMKRVGPYKNHIMHWDSPWGDGFPGWHIECSAMSCKYLGEYFDIHTGGIDHIPVHHTNERAQNIGTYGHEVVKYWIHNAFVQAGDGGKLSKSLGNSWTLQELIEKGFDPLDVRFIFISVNYRVPVKFSLENLQQARNSRLNLYSKFALHVALADKDNGIVNDTLKQEFIDALEDDLNMSQAFAVVNKALDSDFSHEDIVATLLDFDKVLGLKFNEVKNEVKNVNSKKDVRESLQERLLAKEEKRFDEADKIREQLNKRKLEVIDAKDKSVVIPRYNE